MIRYQEIENRLLEIDGVLFQNICDALLYYTEENYPNIFRSGSKIGKLRAVKGTPDTFFMLPNGRYILVEYTVQDPSDHKALITKIKGDIDKCLDSKKTGLALVDIERIIYCCTALDIPRKVYQYFRFETLPGFPTQRLPATAGLL